MKIDSGSLFFNAPTTKPGATASWGTALGQGKDKKINRGSDILVAMDYCSVPIDAVECDLGQSVITKAAVFRKVFVCYKRQKFVISKPFILLVTKEIEGSWKNRLTLKYAISAKKENEGLDNKDCLDEISDLLGGANVCWFAYDIDVKNQDELIFSIIKVSDNKVVYPDSQKRGEIWNTLIKKQSTYEAIQRKNTFVKWLEYKDNCRSQVKNYKTHIVELLETSLDQNIPGEGIGNLFHLNLEDFTYESARISKLSAFKRFNNKDQTQRPQAALNHYYKFLNSISFNPIQIVYYGVPGCGKSWMVNDEIDSILKKQGLEDKEFHKVRCVFHPEYSNADFVGQIYPYVKPNNEGVEYRFKPGPFAEIVRRAYHNPNEPYFLIIEEINRGNAAAIFGEMFQLLDRIEPGDDPDKSTENTYNKGWSSYGVDNIDVNAYIRQNKTDAADIITYAESVTYDNQVSFTLDTAIRLPPNLSVYATMNTSDQNVFTMDNAFQRRFKSKMIRNSLDDTAQSDLKIGDTGVRWGDFRDWINVKILAPETGLNKAEDKCLGGWFIKGEKKTDQDGKALNECKDFPKDEFAEKVLKYLWNDVFKRNAAEKVFLKDKVTSLTNLIEQFESGEKFAAFENVFVITEADKALLLHQKNNP